MACSILAAFRWVETLQSVSSQGGSNGSCLLVGNFKNLLTEAMHQIMKSTGVDCVWIPKIVYVAEYASFPVDPRVRNDESQALDCHAWEENFSASTIAPIMTFNLYNQRPIHDSSKAQGVPSPQ